jgi:plastocyanin
MNRISASLVVCVGAGVFTAAALFREPSNPPTVPAPAAPVVPSGAGTGSVTYGGGGGATVASARLEIADFRFGEITARAGGAIELVNRDGAEHTVTADDGAFDVSIDGGASGSFTAPAAPGTYTFFCALHPQMQGTLTVA